MSKFKDMSDDYLKRNYVPDVYQPSIHAIDYEKLKAHGIKAISFDIDDTIAALTDHNPPKSTITKFEDLKKMGFDLILITNAGDGRGERFADALGVPYIASAEKPSTAHFEKILDRFGLEKSQMAHVGNSMTRDVAGGNAFGVTTCLVRNVGKAAVGGNKIQKVLGGTEGQQIKEEMKERNIWRKHHKYEKGDQYYQLGEMPKYLSGKK